MNETSLRPCKPSDFREAVPLIYSSGPKVFDYVFRNEVKTSMGFLHFAFQKPGGEFSYDKHTALVRDGELIGVGAVFSGKAAGSFTFYDGKKILQYYKLRSAPVIKHGLSIEQIIKLPKKGEICIAHLGVREDHRSKGYGKTLIECLMRQQPLNNGHKYVLDVSEENPRARFLYERMGFEIRKTIMSTLKNKYGEVVNHIRMEKSDR